MNLLLNVTMLGLKKCQKRTVDSRNKTKHNTTVRSGRVVYTLPKKSRKRIVDLVLTIMDSDGPKPMRNMKPVEKHRTGADQFSVQHHGEYEARGQQSSDKVDRVLAHNKACPKMYDELDKRRSTGKPVLNTNNARRSETSLDADNYVCVDCKRYERARRRRRHFRRLLHSHSYKRFKIKKANALARLMKQKRNNKPYKYAADMYQFSRIALNKSCQCATRIVPTKSKPPPKVDDYFLSLMPKKMSVVRMNAPNAVLSNRGLVLRSVKSPIYIMRGGKKSVADTDSGRPDTISSPRSTSSYNSYNSMEHEPMVK
ncbi:uncharacterized protein LOC118278726 isoform X1 [Spodoptera frugiperda]|uniref:Uncharacterized protein LOC118278726 isoform X1 n=2 Tax=Spodoptera frugiperda TaxID=7108 RepID=A0A9R0DHR7_SPOFR|nr:uncharacterized protein LOC118278726 isoform X1 [Spodoptera frugiperda]